MNRLNLEIIKLKNFKWKWLVNQKKAKLKKYPNKILKSKNQKIKKSKNQKIKKSKNQKIKKSK
jgi:hypothetical protein